MVSPMPLKIIPTPDDPNSSRRVVYVPDPYDMRDTRPQARPRPQGNYHRDAAGQLVRVDRSDRLDREFFVGLDLGQAADFTALAVVERLPSGFTVPMLTRTRGRPYPEIVGRVTDLVTSPPLAGASRLVLDATGVGRPVLDLFRGAGLDAMAITITGANRVTGTMRNARVPKRDLVNVVLLALQAGTLTIPAELEHTATLARELSEMRRKVSASGHDSYGVWRDGEHDDLVLALALALWLAERAPCRLHPVPSGALAGDLGNDSNPER